MKGVAIFLLQIVLQGEVETKTRSWLGPTQLIQGTPPIARDSFGFTSVGGSVFVYGGIGDIIGDALHLLT